ncbi:hypothetical protein ACH33_15945 [Aneurinibacillus sp. XH2]|nr:hypothetical protein [Aneurinibacillus thermoaerophilus]AMA74162.1 hypothetical protein ACH33_15945 [Aneurinibacillus sp. XH2]
MLCTGGNSAGCGVGIKGKEKNSQNFSAEIMRLLTVAIRTESDPYTVTFPMPQEIPDDVLQWVKEDENKKMLGRFIYAALTGLQGQMPGTFQQTKPEKSKEKMEADEAARKAAAMFLNDDE